MGQLIYLSRHGTTLRNMQQEAHPDQPCLADSHFDNELTVSGVQEARILGRYLNKLEVKNPVFIDSGQHRTVMTAHLAAAPMNLALILGVNHYSSPALEENVPRECLTPEQQAEYQRGCYHGKPVQAALTLGKEVQAELCRIGDIYPGRDLIAILHGGINAGLMAYITGKLEIMQNCGLYVLEREQQQLKVRDKYLSYAELVKRI